MLLASFAGTASAGTGGAPTPSGSPPPPASRPGTPDAAPSVGSLHLVAAETSPRKSFYYGVRYPRLAYTIGSNQPSNDLRIDVVDAAGGTVKTFYRNDVAPNVQDSIRWDGTGNDGRPAPNGHYRFQISTQGESPQAMQSSAGAAKLGFSLYGYAFPVLGAHDFGGAQSVFGAGRAGHTHQGHDVMADCGLPLVAARGGRVQYSGWDDAAGNYVVIDGRGTGLDTAYMHLLQPSPLKAGMTVRTGQPLGLVGSTGSSTACHLQLEIWTAPGWYECGSPVDPLPYLLKWDRNS
jgi:murein DD-endopeptidase MepM/ murein hydrolase activator NlpD